MGLYSDTRTVEVTTAQIAEMVRAQKKVVELLADNKVNESIVRNTYASYSGAVLGLVFVASTVFSVAAGFISLSLRYGKIMVDERCKHRIHSF